MKVQIPAQEACIVSTALFSGRILVHTWAKKSINEAFLGQRLKATPAIKAEVAYQSHHSSCDWRLMVFSTELTILQICQFLGHEAWLKDQNLSEAWKRFDHSTVFAFKARDRSGLYRDLLAESARPITIWDGYRWFLRISDGVIKA